MSPSGGASKLNELVCGTFDDGAATGTATVTSPAGWKVNVRSIVWAGDRSWARSTSVTVGAFTPRKTDERAGIVMSSARLPSLAVAGGGVGVAAPDGEGAPTGAHGGPATRHPQNPTPPGPVSP